MKYKLTTLIHPGSQFGLPQQGMTVLPSGIKEVFGPGIDTLSGQTVGYGSLSEYRSDEEAINVSLETDSYVVSIRDNIAVVELEAEIPSDAYNDAVELLDKFLTHLSVSRGTLFSHIPYILESEDQRLYPIPRPMHMVSVTVYDVAQLSKDITDIQGYLPMDDDRLARAMDYFGQATLIFQGRTQLTNAFSRHHTLLISSAFLNLWKAISAIVGDPSTDKDYQKRYRSYGFDKKFFDEKIEKVRKLRNEYDVAHYSLHADDIEQIEQSFGEAQKIALEVIRKYRTFLQNAS